MNGSNAGVGWFTRKICPDVAWLSSSVGASIDYGNPTRMSDAYNGRSTPSKIIWRGSQQGTTSFIR